MSQEGDPWKVQRPSTDPGPNPEPAPAARWPAIVFAVALAVMVLALHRAFPEAMRTPDDWTDVAYRLGIVVLVCAGGFRALQGPLSQHLRHAAIWTVIIAVLALGYAYRGALAGVGQRLQLAFSGGDPVSLREHELAIPRDESGGFTVVARVNGQRVRFLVDTGATETVLSPDDARRLGVDVDHLSFDRQSETANGLGYGAGWSADRLDVGDIRLDAFPMTINKAPMSTSLLGMSFLGRLESFEARRDTLTLKWRAGAD